MNELWNNESSTNEYGNEKFIWNNATNNVYYLWG